MRLKPIAPTSSVRRTALIIRRDRSARLQDIPQTVEVVTEAVIRDQRALSVQDVLKNEPGVGVAHEDGQYDAVTERRRFRFAADGRLAACDLL